MARELRNISGQTRCLQDAAGVWHVVEDGGTYLVADGDERYYQTGDTGETAIWADVTKPASKSKTKDEE